MGKFKFVLALYSIIIIGALVGVFYLGSIREGKEETSSKTENNVAGVQSDKPDYLERLAKTLAEKGMVFYGSLQSSDSVKQKELFGQSASFLDYVECDASGENAYPEECVAKEITVYPTWVYQNQKYEGIQKLSDLAKVVGFSD